jgi:NADPH:quinone reductase-like Zn-dependent oxidoreductase
MKAVRFHTYGATDVLVHEEADRPAAGPGEVVVKVAGAAFNPVDLPIRLGVVQQAFPVVLPHIPCYDVSGVIAELGEGVSGWSVGDEVVAWLPIAGPGAAAEFAAVPAESLGRAPRSVDLADAAALPSTGLVSWQLLFEHVGLKRGQSILVSGAGGAAGGFIVQLAKRAGAVVTATASPDSAERVRSYGADRVVDYTGTPVYEALAGEKFDVAVNLVASAGNEELAKVADLVADGGAFANTVPPGLPEIGRGVRNLGVLGRSAGAELSELSSLVDAGELKIHVAQRRPLAELRAVHEQAEAGKLPGKTVLIP